jgi:hypothetical protein
MVPYHVSGSTVEDRPRGAEARDGLVIDERISSILVMKRGIK